MLFHFASRGCKNENSSRSHTYLEPLLVFCWTGAYPVSVILLSTVRGSIWCKINMPLSSRSLTTEPSTRSNNYIFMTSFRAIYTDKEEDCSQNKGGNSLKMYFCLPWQNRRGLWAAMKVSSEVNGVWVGRILNVITLFEVESFQSGETQVRGTKLFLSLPCAMSKLWSHLQSNSFNGGTIGKTNVQSAFLSSSISSSTLWKFLRPRLLGSLSPSN